MLLAADHWADKSRRRQAPTTTTMGLSQVSQAQSPSSVKSGDDAESRRRNAAVLEQRLVAGAQARPKVDAVRRTRASGRAARAMGSAEAKGSPSASPVREGSIEGAGSSTSCPSS